MIEIALTQDRVALVDDVDADLAERRWHVTSGYAAYAVWAGGRRTIYMHRLIAERMGIEGLADHENRERLDNRRANLRPATQSQNVGNTEPRGASGLIGVREYRPGRWCVDVAREGQRLRRYGFDTPSAAAACRVEILERLGSY